MKDFYSIQKKIQAKEEAVKQFLKDYGCSQQELDQVVAFAIHNSSDKGYDLVHHYIGEAHKFFGEMKTHLAHQFLNRAKYVTEHNKGA